MALRLYYHHNSSAALRVLLALRMKGVPAQHVSLVEVLQNSGSRGEAQWRLPPDDVESQRLGTTDYLAFNREGRIPVLVVGTQQITQSIAIINYIDAALGGSGAACLYPADPLIRARVDQVASIVACDVHPLQNMGLIQEAVRDFGMLPGDIKTHPFRLHFMRRGMTALEALVAKYAGRFAVGDTCTAADCFLVPQVRNCLGAGIDVAAEFPTVHAIWSACIALPEIRSTLEAMGGLSQPGDEKAAVAEL